MKRTPFKPKAPARLERRDRSAEFASFKPKARPAAAAVMPALLQLRQPVAAPKDGRHTSEAWRRAVASLPCVLCNKRGETQCAHRNELKGMALKTDDALTAGLCLTCHAEIDQGSNLTREERRRRMDVAILLTIRALARAGRLVIKDES